jgi:cytochrome c oxidase cbb3-type subunit III
MDSSKQKTAVALTAFACALLWAAVDPAVARAEADKQASADRGQKIFVTTCSFCHGPQAKGGEGGPDLLRSVLVLDDVDGDKIGPVILGGRRDKGMPQFALTPAQISDIASFLHHSIDAAAERNSYQILNIVTGDPKAGEAYFNGSGKCNTCHSVTGDLKGIGGKYDPVTLQGMILMPGGGQRGHGAGARLNTGRTVTVTLASGQVFEGELEHIDDFNVALRDSSGNYRSFTRNADSPVVEVHDPLQAHADMLTKYTDADIHNLTAYLVNLK